MILYHYVILCYIMLYSITYHCTISPPSQAAARPENMITVRLSYAEIYNELMRPHSNSFLSQIES